jgi:uncharacterized membrane protein YdjX (TVP38/TMEM64 family)
VTEVLEIDRAPGSANMRRVWIQRMALVAAWVTALVAWRWYQTSSGLGADDVGQRFIDHVDAAWWGIAAYIAVYLVRPVVLFPASILTVVAGVLFGPYVGVAVVVVAANASAMIAYGIGRGLRYTRRPTTETTDASFAERWSEQLRDNSFETVLVMRLLFLPYDLVSYLCGVLRIKWPAFLAATALGSLPGTVSFVLIGSSLERVDQGFGGIDRLALAAGLAIFVASLAGARLLRRRRRAETDPNGRERKLHT